VPSQLDLNVTDYRPLPAPAELLAELPRSPGQTERVQESRRAIRRILRGEDRRLFAIVGPCSIHDVKGALEYARRLAALARELDDRMLVAMRVYLEKPRTAGGWKGLIPDPHLDGTGDLGQGLRLGRELLRQVIDLGLVTATEFLEPAAPAYLSDLVGWASIGARTAESQPHRQLASALPMPLGFKNATSGAIQPAVHGMKAAAEPQTYLGLNPLGLPAAVRTRGNPDCHLVLRGGASGPNYDPIHVALADTALEKAGLLRAIVIDCSHGNSTRQPHRQPEIARSVVGQIRNGSRSIVGLMLESNLFAGSQSLAHGRDRLRYGVSITDPCLDWDATERCLREAHAALADRFATAPAAVRLPAGPVTGRAVA
jgi:3-deoxy-7-phosphoheptulonate synthase